MSSADDEDLERQLDMLLHRSVYAQATGILKVRLDIPIEAAADYLFRMADETGVEDIDLAEMIVRACEQRQARPEPP